VEYSRFIPEGKLKERPSALRSGPPAPEERFALGKRPKTLEKHYSLFVIRYWEKERASPVTKKC
jgi:hypothetical protein